jgi:transposase
LRRKSAGLQLGLEGSVNMHQRALLRRQLSHVEFLEQGIEELNVEIEERMRLFAAAADLIDGIWGLGRRSAEAILAETSSI